VEPTTDTLSPARAERIPVTVVAGFLGSGKTTLVNRILAGGHGLRVAVLVNDFGRVSIDARLVVSRDATTITLDNGCICCSISTDLVTQLVQLLEGPDAPEHVVVESSGVSDPGRLLVALRDPYLRRLARLDGVITLVDAAAAGEIPPQAQELARRQLASADVIVLNKCDLVDANDLSALRAHVAHPGARVLEAAHADVPLEVVLGVEPHEAERSGEHDAAAADHTDGFATWSWSSTTPLSYEAVRQVLGSLPAGVFRAKGFLHLVETPGERVVAHVVGRRVDIRPLGAWDVPQPCSELVFISLDGGIDTVGLRERLTATAA
jgi:G3E family GTPase